MEKQQLWKPLQWNSNVFIKWFILVAGFLILCTIAILDNTVWSNEKECEKDLPTISSSLMRDDTSYRAFVIILFTISLFLFLNLKHKSLLVSLFLFMLAFVINYKQSDSDKKCHMDLVIGGSGVVYIALFVRLYENWKIDSGFWKAYAIISFIVSFVTGVFFVYYELDGQIEACDPKMYLEYLWLGFLLISTLYLVEKDTEMKENGNDEENKPLTSSNNLLF